VLTAVPDVERKSEASCQILKNWRGILLVRFFTLLNGDVGIQDGELAGYIACSACKQLYAYRSGLSVSSVSKHKCRFSKSTDDSSSPILPFSTDFTRTFAKMAILTNRDLKHEYSPCSDLFGQIALSLSD
jgi:hypothetical protein